MAHSKSLEPTVFPIIFPASVTATATRTCPAQVGGVTAAPWFLKSARVLTSANFTGDNTNKFLIEIKKGTIGVPVTIASLDLVLGTDLVANTPFEVTMPTTAAGLELRKLVETDVLHCVLTEAGAATLTDFQVALEITPVVDHLVGV